MKPTKLLFLAAALLIAGCATVADVLESPTTSEIISIASASGASSLTMAMGAKPSAPQTAILNTAAAAAIQTTTTDAVWWFAEWLRSKQSTSSAAKSGVLATQVPVPIATAVTQLAATGVPPDVANEAIAMTISSVAAQKGK